MLRRLRPVEQGRDGRQEIVGDGAADAAVRQLDDVLFRAILDAAALDDLAIDAELAELVDDERDPPPARNAQQVLDQAGLPGAEEAGHDRRGNLAAHNSLASYCISVFGG